MENFNDKSEVCPPSNDDARWVSGGFYRFGVKYAIGFDPGYGAKGKSTVLKIDGDIIEDISKRKN